MTELDRKVKDPDAVKDYAWEWRRPGDPWLEVGEEITTHTVFVDPDEADGVAVDTSSVTDDDRVVAWLSGGVAGLDYRVTCRVETSAGRREDASIIVLCRHT